jgi:DNA-binding CsgD family transcriptional regulator
VKTASSRRLTSLLHFVSGKRIARWSRSSLRIEPFDMEAGSGAFFTQDDTLTPAFRQSSTCTLRRRAPSSGARTELAFGEFLRRARRPREARQHLRAALDGFEALGAEVWAERARVELRASGQTARRRVADTRDQLTEQELQIAHFVAQGLSNREVAAQLFLSPRTIAAHLRNIFRKLGISSRTELARRHLESVGAAADDAADAAVEPTPV